MNLGNRNYLAETFGCKGATTLAIPGTLGIQRRTIVQLFAALALLSILFGATQSYAQPWTQVQGRLIGNGYYGPSPVGGVVLTLFNSQVGRTTRSVSRPDGTFYFRNIPFGWYNVEVWFPNSPYPLTFRVLVNQMPVSYVGTFQLDMPVGVQRPRGAGVRPGYGGWLRSGL
jgi:hypothetical protein